MNGTPASTSYGYRGTGRSLSDEEAAARLSQAATTRPSQLATSREARAATPVPAVVPGTVIPPDPAALPPAKVRGAVKVDAFPVRSIYPFAEIAEDGGIWQINPAEFKSKPESIRAAASKWASSKGLSAKTVIDGGALFVQFRRPE